MDRSEWRRLAWMVGIFLGLVFLPLSDPGVHRAVGQGLVLASWYAREHVVLCLLPAFLIAGAIAAFVDKGAILRFLGPGARKTTAYGVGALSGSVLAVCSCTVLPLFAGIHRMGAGLGPAIAFLYAGPAINVLAIILTARVLGAEMGVARGLGAVIFSVVIGALMARLFERGSSAAKAAPVLPEQEDGLPPRALVGLLGTLAAVLVFANWTESAAATGLWAVVAGAKWWLTAGGGVGLALVLGRWFGFPAPALAGVALATTGTALAFPDVPSVPFAAAVVGLCAIMPTAGERGRAWWSETWTYTRLVAPLLLGGVFVSGVLLGTEAAPGLIPSSWVENAVGGNGVGANVGASLVGALMYFATLTEIPIVEGLTRAGMGSGPALALLLAGPTLSLPNMIVIHRVLGTRRTLAFVAMVVVFAAATGLAFGAWSGA